MKLRQPKKNLANLYLLGYSYLLLTLLTVKEFVEKNFVTDFISHCSKGTIPWGFF